MLLVSQLVIKRILSYSNYNSYYFNCIPILTISLLKIYLDIKTLDNTELFTYKL